MNYFSIRDSEKKYPLNLETGNFDQSWFFKFCIRWFNISLPNAFNLQSKLPEKEKPIESVLPLLIEAKKEIELLPQTLNFLPDWSVFRTLNHWISKFFRVQKNELIRSLVEKIEEATLKTPSILQRDDAVDRNIMQCMEDHRKEIATQPQVKHCQTYQQVRSEMEKSTEKLHHLRKHREWVVEHEGPKGKPIFHHIGEAIYLTYYPPSVKEQSDFDRTRLVQVDSDIEMEKRSIRKIATKGEGFFLPAKYNNPITYKELLDQRTKVALESLCHSPSTKTSMLP